MFELVPQSPTVYTENILHIFLPVRFSCLQRRGSTIHPVGHDRRRAAFFWHDDPGDIQQSRRRIRADAEGDIALADPRPLQLLQSAELRRRRYARFQTAFGPRGEPSFRYRRGGRQLRRRGTAFELTPARPPPWRATILYSFCQVTACSDGGSPYGGLVAAAGSKNFYGVTSMGGANNNAGTVFEISP